VDLSTFAFGAAMRKPRDREHAQNNELLDNDDDVEETNLTLLTKTQHYLRGVLALQVPDSILTSAWNRFYSIYDVLIRGYVATRRMPPAELEDCVQEVWLAVARGLTEFEHPRNRPGLRAWLYTLVRAKTAEVLRKRARFHSGMVPSTDVQLQLIPADGEHTSRQMWTRLLVQALLDDVQASQPDEDHQILRLKLLEGRRTGEIAEQLGLAPRVVRYRFRRVLRRIRWRMSVFTGEPLRDWSPI
jgi:RNA polymerase sigma factor (sigma-70 family)